MTNYIAHVDLDPLGLEPMIYRDIEDLLTPRVDRLLFRRLESHFRVHVINPVRQVWLPVWMSPPMGPR